MRTGGVVLAGGRSSRMGTAKAALEWHGSTLLRRTVGILARCAEASVLVVAAPGQELPDVGEARVVEDPVGGRGPLQGLATGLAAAAESGAEVAFVCATDLPFLHPAFVRRVLAAAEEEGTEVVLPTVDGRPQPLAAAYRTALAGRAATLLAARSAGPADLIATCRTLELDTRALLADPALRAADPQLASLQDVDDPAAYHRARALPPPLVEVSGSAGGPGVTVRAATVGAALAAAGVAGSPPATIDGSHTTTDGTTPLVAGDHVIASSPASSPTGSAHP